MEFDDHAKKCKAIQWHPIAEHVLASYAEDSTVRVWDVNTGDCAITFTDVDETALAMRWSPVGDKIGCMIKKNTMAIFDPRVANSVMRAASHHWAYTTVLMLIYGLVGGRPRGSAKRAILQDCTKP